MSTMVERVARAICEADCGRITDNELDRCRELARAAIEAMKDAEPTDEMMSAMWSLSHSNTKESFSACWHAMISAALSEKGGENE